MQFDQKIQQIIILTLFVFNIYYYCYYYYFFFTFYLTICHFMLYKTFFFLNLVNPIFLEMWRKKHINYLIN